MADYSIRIHRRSWTWRLWCVLLMMALLDSVALFADRWYRSPMDERIGGVANALLALGLIQVALGIGMWSAYSIVASFKENRLWPVWTGLVSLATLMAWAKIPYSDGFLERWNPGDQGSFEEAVRLFHNGALRANSSGTINLPPRLASLSDGGAVWPFGDKGSESIIFDLAGPCN